LGFGACRPGTAPTLTPCAIEAPILSSRTLWSADARSLDASKAQTLAPDFPEAARLARRGFDDRSLAAVAPTRPPWTPRGADTRSLARRGADGSELALERRTSLSVHRTCLSSSKVGAAVFATCNSLQLATRGPQHAAVPHYASASGIAPRPSKWGRRKWSAWGEGPPKRTTYMSRVAVSNLLS
jgi:hypothetical protein